MIANLASNRNAANQFSETVKGAGSTASKEANKSMFPIYIFWFRSTNLSALDVAKDNNASLGTRASAAKDALGDKVDEQKHEVWDPIGL